MFVPALLLVTYFAYHFEAAARLKLEEGEPDAALKELEQGLLRAPSLELYVKYIMALVNNRQYEDAIAMLEQAQEKQSLYNDYSDAKFGTAEPPADVVRRKRWLTTYLDPSNRVYPHYSEEFVWALAHLSDGFAADAKRALASACELAPDRKIQLEEHFEKSRQAMKSRSNR
jgi:tetratricopeptide (TPR) repeat protein